MLVHQRVTKYINDVSQKMMMPWVEKDPVSLHNPWRSILNLIYKRGTPKSAYLMRFPMLQIRTRQPGESSTRKLWSEWSSPSFWRRWYSAEWHPGSRQGSWGFFKTWVPYLVGWCWLMLVDVGWCWLMQTFFFQPISGSDRNRLVMFCPLELVISHCQIMASRNPNVHLTLLKLSCSWWVQFAFSLPRIRIPSGKQTLAVDNSPLYNIR